MFDKENRVSKIVEIELPTGIRIAECTGCNGNIFQMYLNTVCKVKVSNTGFFTIVNPRLSIDLVSKRLKPENITCARCHSVYGEEKKL